MYPNVAKICLWLLSVIIGHQFPPGNLSSFLFKIALPKNTKTSTVAQFPTGLLNLNLVCSVALDSEQVGGDAQDGPYQEESERPWRSKVTSRISSWEGQRRLVQGWERSVTEHMEEGSYRNLKLEGEQTEVWNAIRCLPGFSCWTLYIRFSPWACRGTQYLYQLLFLWHTRHTYLCIHASELTKLEATMGSLLLA